MKDSKKSLSPLAKFKNSHMLITDYSTSDQDSTLFNPSDDSQEISSQLSLLRKKHDKTKSCNSKKRLYCEKLSFELEKLNTSNMQTDHDSKYFQNKIDHLQSLLSQHKKKHEDELSCKKSYLYMLNRMKQEKISMEMKSKSLQTNLKSTSYTVNTESDKFRKIRENQHQSRVMLQEIKATIAVEQRKKSEKISQLEKSIKKRQDLTYKREERLRRQAEVSEAAANDDRDSQESKLRENILLHRMWFIFVCKRFHNEVKKNQSLEQAYKMIKSYTGLSDVNDIVERYLTRENNYTSLIRAVAEAENKVELLKRENEEMREKAESARFEETGSVRKVYMEIDEAEQELTEGYRGYALAKEKLEKDAAAYKVLANWGEKICFNLGIKGKLQEIEGNRLHGEGSCLKDLFDAIGSRVDEVVKVLEGDEKIKNEFEGLGRRKTQDIIRELADIDTLKKISVEDNFEVFY